MKHVKLFEEWTPQTANLQKVRISTTDSNGMISMIGHLVQEYDNYFFIPEEGGFEWIEKRHTPPYLMRIEKTFNENIGKKLLINVGMDGDGGSIKFGENNYNSSLWIQGILYGETGAKIELI